MPSTHCHILSPTTGGHGHGRLDHLDVLAALASCELPSAQAQMGPLRSL